MNIKIEEFDRLIATTGSPALNLSTRRAIVRELCNWFFVRQEPESEVTQRVREYQIEMDNVGYVKWLRD